MELCSMSTLHLYSYAMQRCSIWTVTENPKWLNPCSEQHWDLVMASLHPFTPFQIKFPFFTFFRVTCVPRRTWHSTRCWSNSKICSNQQWPSYSVTRLELWRMSIWCLQSSHYLRSSQGPSSFLSRERAWSYSITRQGLWCWCLPNFQAQAVGYITRVTLYQVHISSVSFLSVSDSSFFLSFFLVTGENSSASTTQKNLLQCNAMWLDDDICAFFSLQRGRGQLSHHAWTHHVGRWVWH